MQQQAEQPKKQKLTVGVVIGLVLLVCAFVGAVWLAEAFMRGPAGPLAGLYAYWWGWIPGFIFLAGLGWFLAKRG
jgi:hypothetical protein